MDKSSQARPHPDQRAIVYLAGAEDIPPQALLEAAERMRAAVAALGIDVVKIKVDPQPPVSSA